MKSAQHREKNSMIDEWIKECNNFLTQLKKYTSSEEPDRLELVRSMHWALLAINHSTLGWLQYVNNPDIMSMFDREELNIITENLNKFAESYIGYDIEITKKGIQKGLKERKQKEQKTQSFYV